MSPNQPEQDSSSSGEKGLGVAGAWAMSVEEVARELSVDLEEGLSSEEAEKRLGEYGRNRLRERKPVSPWTILLNQFKSLVILLLAAAAVASLIFAQWPEAIAIACVVLVNTAIGFFTELKAIRSMEALRKLAQTESTVKRDGELRHVAASELVPGDVAAFEAGDVISADLRLAEAAKLEVNESTLTGESMAVGKQTKPVEEDAPLAERPSMAFKGTTITRGSGEGIVVATGMATELGKIASLTAEAEQSETPLERRLEQLGRRLIWIVLIIAAVMIGVGLLRGKDTLLMVETGVALAVAAIPEGLPIVATLALARGMWRMAKRNALVNRLSAVETLGATSVILTDKTGTLTENQMTATRLVLEDGDIEIEGRGLTTEGAFHRDDQTLDPREDELVRRAIEIGVLCNNASLGSAEDESQETGDERQSKPVGDPMEVALLVAGEKAGLARDELLDKQPEEREEAFDPETKAMATFHESDGGYRVAVKGAPESVLSYCNRVLTSDGDRDLDDEEAWLARGDALASEGLRLLAVAEKKAGSTEEDPYEDLTLVGLVAMLDPPREDVKDAISACKDAGIRVVMVTGDQAGTAASIAQAVGLADEDDEGVVISGRDLTDDDDSNTDDDDSNGAERRRRTVVFARMAPEQKLRLIEDHQEAGAIVAMTGDGVNDAPALQKADIGVAMGMRGAEAAKQAADMVLRDDNFTTIVRAVEHGRTIFANIRKSVMFMLCTNVAEVLAVSIATFAAWTLPLRPLQILYLNVLTDVFPALALGVSAGSGLEMKDPPRDPKEAILTRGHWIRILVWSAILATGVLGSMHIAEQWLEFDTGAAVTVSFLTLGFSKLWFTFNLRNPRGGLIRNEVVQNPWVWGAIALCIVLLVLAVYLPGLSDVLGTADIGWKGWGVMLGFSVVPLVIGQIWLLVRGGAALRTEPADDQSGQRDTKRLEGAEE